MKVRFSQKHLDWISARLRERIALSRDAMSRRYDQWAKNEELFAAYVPAAEEERKGEMQYATIQVPYSYAIVMTMHTYFTSVFLARSPIFQFVGRHGESEMQVQAVEALIDYQITVGGNQVPLFLWLFDPLKYGVGWIGSYWDKEIVQCRRRVRRPKMFMGVPIPGTEETVEIVEEVVGYEGNRLYNIRPQDAFPDPRVPMWNFQRGEFFGRYVELTWSEILAGHAEGKYFDIEMLRERSGATARERDMGSPHSSHLPNADSYIRVADNEASARPVIGAYEVFVRLIPSEWRLADSDREEVWVFHCTADDYKVFGVQPLGLYHGKFPIDVIEIEPDAYNFFSRSPLEIMAPVNDALTWLVNSHMYNVRAALNNQFIYDPSMLYSHELENPNPGKLLKLKPAGYGRDVRTVIAQLPVADVTRSHIGDMQIMTDLLQRMTGVNDNIMGMVNVGGRKTATEVRQSTTLGVNRLKTCCELISAMGFQPLAQKLLQQTQQFYNREMQYRIVGDQSSFAPQFVNVSPDSIAGFYDIIPADGTLPVDRYAQANLWQVILAQISRIPQIAANYDLGRIFAYVANLAGLKNIQQFRVQAVPDEQIAAAAQAGNVVPLEPNQRDLGLPPDEMQIPGMGATA